MYIYIYISGWWWLEHDFYFPTNIGKFIIPIDVYSFRRGWNHQPDMVWFYMFFNEWFFTNDMLMNDILMNDLMSLLLLVGRKNRNACLMGLNWGRTSCEIMYIGIMWYRWIYTYTTPFIHGCFSPTHSISPHSPGFSQEFFQLYAAPACRRCAPTSAPTPV